MLKFNQDLVFLIIIIIWAVSGIGTWIIFGAKFIVLSNLIMILIFGVLTKLAYVNEPFKKWLRKKI